MEFFINWAGEFTRWFIKYLTTAGVAAFLVNVGLTYLWITNRQKWGWINADQQMSEYELQEASAGNYIPLMSSKAVWSISFATIMSVITVFSNSIQNHYWNMPAAQIFSAIVQNFATATIFMSRSGWWRSIAADIVNSFLMMFLASVRANFARIDILSDLYLLDRAANICICCRH